MLDLFDKLSWVRPPRHTPGRPLICEFRFVGSVYTPPTDRAYAVVTDRDVIRYVRRRMRRELRKIVKTFGTIPRHLRTNPFWWTSRNTILVAEEVS